MTTATCPACGKLCSLPDAFTGGKVTCPTCHATISIPLAQAIQTAPMAAPLSPLIFDVDLVSNEAPRRVEPKTHSALGMASFIIALLVGGLDLILIFVIAVNMATTRGPAIREDLATQAIGGGISITCLNCMSIPLCLVGVGLAFVGLIAQRDRNHLFSWIGLLGNGTVIVCAIGIYVAGSVMASAAKQNQDAPQQQKPLPPKRF